MPAFGMLQDARVRVGALVGICFLLGSTGWLAWLYRITDLAEPTMVDFYTMVLGYLAQVAGIGVHMIVRYKADRRVSANAAMVAIGLYVVLMEPATMSDGLAATLGFGYAMNVMCGFFQGHYLCCLAALVGESGRGATFGGGYAASTFATWLLSTVDGGNLTTGASNLLVCILLALLALVCVRAVAVLPALVDDHAEDGASSAQLREKTASSFTVTRGLLVLAGVTVVAISLVKNAGFSFPAADLSGVVNLELSRLFYGIGLVIAGVLADRDRRYALLCCAVSLVTPFLMLALSGGGASGVTLWVLGYLLFGFFSVFRVVLFVDLADASGRVWLAGAGLALGRVGDVLGTALCLALGGSAVMLVAVSGALFVVAAVLLFALYNRMYGARRKEGEDKGDSFDPLDEFSGRYGLSRREQDVLFFIVNGSPNGKICRELSITEATVKFHVHNILVKTGCANRVEVARLYASQTKSR